MYLISSFASFGGLQASRRQGSKRPSSVGRARPKSAAMTREGRGRDQDGLFCFRKRALSREIIWD